MGLCWSSGAEPGVAVDAERSQPVGRVGVAYSACYQLTSGHRVVVRYFGESTAQSAQWVVSEVCRADDGAPVMVVATGR